MDIQRILQTTFPDVSGINTDGLTGMLSSVSGFFSNFLNSICGSLGIETDVTADDISNAIGSRVETSVASAIDKHSGILAPLAEALGDGKITGQELQSAFTSAAEGTTQTPDPAQTADPVQPVSAPAPAGQ